MENNYNRRMIFWRDRCCVEINGSVIYIMMIILFITNIAYKEVEIIYWLLGCIGLSEGILCVSVAP